MIDIDGVCRALAAAVEVVRPKLRCLDMVPSAPAGPTFYVAEIEIDYSGGQYDGDAPVDVTCRVVVPPGDATSGQRALRRYMAMSGSASVRAAINALNAEALAGVADDVVVVRQQNHRAYTFGAGEEWPGFELAVNVI